MFSYYVYYFKATKQKEYYRVTKYFNKLEDAENEFFKIKQEIMTYDATQIMSFVELYEFDSYYGDMVISYFTNNPNEEEEEEEKHVL